MAWTRAALGFVAIVAAVGLLVSGGSSADPRTPAALPGEPPPFLGTMVVGSGGLTAAIDAYGDVVDLRSPGPAGPGLIDNPAARQAAGTVAADTGVVTRVSVDGGPALPLWRADSIRQGYLPGTNVSRTEAKFGATRVEITTAVAGRTLERCVRAVGPSGEPVGVDSAVNFGGGTAVNLASGTLTGGAKVGCSAAAIHRSAAADRRWLAGARPLGRGAPAWARRAYIRSLLVLRALSDRRSGAVAAGARDGWAYVWPRDAATAALAFSAAGYAHEARRVALFLASLDLSGAARFDGDGDPVPGRGPQGDAWGWAAAAARAAGTPPPTGRPAWRDLPDYQEKASGDYLANAIASAREPAEAAKASASGERASRWLRVAKAAPFKKRSPGRPGATVGWRGPPLQQSRHRAQGRKYGRTPALTREVDDPRSGWDTAAAWAVRPFALRSLYPAVRVSLRQALSREGRLGLPPSADWPDRDPWSAPTAWTAWSLAALGERRQALRLMGDLRRATTPAGLLPERVDARTGIPTSTTPLAWSHAFAILALRELWPNPPGRTPP